MEFESLTEIVNQYVIPALGDFAADYDAAGIAHDLFDVSERGLLVPSAAASDGEGGIDADAFWAACENNLI